MILLFYKRCLPLRNVEKRRDAYFEEDQLGWELSLSNVTL